MEKTVQEFRWYVDDVYDIYGISAPPNESTIHIVVWKTAGACFITLVMHANWNISLG